MLFVRFMLASMVYRQNEKHIFPTCKIHIKAKVPPKMNSENVSVFVCLFVCFNYYLCVVQQQIGPHLLDLSHLTIQRHLTIGASMKVVLYTWNWKSASWTKCVEKKWYEHLLLLNKKAAFKKGDKHLFYKMRIFFSCTSVGLNTVLPLYTAI